jgi:glycosyltransferase involved in cell wall biosynthesis
MSPQGPGQIKISIVSPVYRSEKIIDELVRRIIEEVKKITDDFEIILVEDGSPDNSWTKIEENCLKDNRVKGIKLSRNFGQHYSITAGLEASKGDFVVVMDCDLQDNPKYISELYNKAQEGYEIVYTQKSERKHSFFKNFTAGLFFSVFNWLSDSQDAGKMVGSFSILSRKVVDNFIKIKDYHRHYLMVLRWMGFKHTYITIEHEKRYAGKSSYNFWRLLKHAVSGVTSQSDKLLYISITVGFLFFIFSIFAAVYLIYLYLEHGFKTGWTSTVVLILLSTGIILMSIGFTGIYIGKIFEQVKERPLYLVEKKTNF